jgi:hypothetical protein
MTGRPHPTAVDFLAYCDAQIAKLLLPARFTDGAEGSYEAARVTAEIQQATLNRLRETYFR